MEVRTTAGWSHEADRSLQLEHIVLGMNARINQLEHSVMSFSHMPLSEPSSSLMPHMPMSECSRSVIEHGRSATLQRSELRPCHGQAHPPSLPVCAPVVEADDTLPALQLKLRLADG